MSDLKILSWVNIVAEQVLFMIEKCDQKKDFHISRHNTLLKSLFPM